MHTRLKILCWQILRDALPTRAKLGQIMTLPSVLCPLCNDEEETSIHLFWQCSFAKAVWYGSLWGIRTDSFLFHDWMGWLQWFNCSRNLPNNLVVSYFNALQREDHQLLNGAVERFYAAVPNLVNWKVKKISRGVNFLAHNSAKWARYHGSVGELAVSNMDVGVFRDDTEWVPDPG
ncbi:hypothetical protein F8388_013423 [Cannabis sativa]|uniref:Reverse transcriptase zinc-binding domain-containing protein n=1 Tax=Cannabis sativa TaxID=3483 RepID=A0A7J6EZI1_CANSA|nr:hypothetical protein F8388_013423 [Cannabis sativa]